MASSSSKITDPGPVQECDLQYKFKVALLGSVESYKYIFQNRVSETALSPRNKTVIGVGISGLHVKVDDIGGQNCRAHAYLSLWDISCDARFASLRPTYYRGSEAIVVILDENTLPQLEEYYTEVVERTNRISLNFLICVENLDAGDVREFLKESRVVDSEKFEIQEIFHPRETINWIIDKFQERITKRNRNDHFGISIISKADFSVDPKLEEDAQSLNYVVPPENLDDLNPSYRVDHRKLARFLEKLHIAVNKRDKSVSLTNSHGTWTVYLDDATTYLTPKACVKCSQSCVRKKFICMIAASRGYSTLEGLHQRELLILSKIFAIVEEEFPDHVQKQIKKACSCKKK